MLQIDHTRTELPDTDEALAYKANIPGRAKETITAKSSQLRERATSAGHQVGGAAETTSPPARALTGAAVAPIAHIMLALFLRRRRNS